MISVCLTVFNYLLLLIGGVMLFKAGMALWTFLRTACTRLNSDWADRYGKGSWAMVTGCTEGIGKAFCFELAALGFNLVLVSRNQKKLQALNKQLWAKHPNLNTVICQSDFSTYSRGLYDNILDKIKEIDLSILVNNVGISHINQFDRQTVKEVEEQINVNIAAMTFLSHKVVPLFLERKKQCAIVNISSQSIDFSLKTLSVYIATKAFNDQFSRCLSEDYRGVIDIVDCVPAIVSTAATKHTKDPMACSAQQCASWTLKALGKTDSTSGHWIHTVQSWFVLLAGQTLVRKIGNQKLQDLTSKKE